MSLNNKLSLNIAKANYMLFSNSASDLPCLLKMNDFTITKTDCCKFLGLFIDCGLTWNSHVDYICKIIARNIGVINRTKHFFPEVVLLSLYNTVIGSYLNYGILAWGASSATNLNRLLLLQKQALCIINFTEFNAHTDPLFIKGNIFKVKDIYRLQLGSLMYQLTCNNLPSAIKSMFTLNSDVHSHFTRQASNFHIPYTRTSLAHKTVKHV